MQSLFTTIALAGAASAALQVRGCQNPKVVQNFDLNAFLGQWYEIVRDKDTSYEHGICNTANYSLKDDGDIRVLNNEWRTDENAWGGGIGSAFVVDPSKDEGYLKVKFVPYVPAGDYKVIGTDYDNYAVIYSCIGLGPLLSQEYVWVLARSPQQTEETKRNILDALELIPKYDIFTNGAYTLQTPEYDCPYASQPI
jgi:apolipoprotein D and lipocalin family protein